MSLRSFAFVAKARTRGDPEYHAGTDALCELKAQRGGDFMFLNEHLAVAILLREGLEAGGHRLIRMPDLERPEEPVDPRRTVTLSITTSRLWETTTLHCMSEGSGPREGAPTLTISQFSILKEDVLRLNAALFGHRYLMDAVTPGGIARDLRSDGVSSRL